MMKLVNKTITFEVGFVARTSIFSCWREFNGTVKEGKFWLSMKKHGFTGIFFIFACIQKIESAHYFLKRIENLGEWATELGSGKVMMDISGSALPKSVYL